MKKMLYTVLLLVGVVSFIYSQGTGNCIPETEECPFTAEHSTCNNQLCSGEGQSCLVLTNPKCCQVDSGPCTNQSGNFTRKKYCNVACHPWYDPQLEPPENE